MKSWQRYAGLFFLAVCVVVIQQSVWVLRLTDAGQPGSGYMPFGLGVILAALSLWLVDQLPLAGDKNVEIKLVRTQPPAQHDPIKGALTWKLPIPPGGKLVTQFVYTLRRPKGYRLSQ